MSIEPTPLDAARDQVSVIIITYRRPNALRECLTHLSAQIAPADQIVVVDASEDGLSADVAREFGDVTYMRNPAGVGNMSNSRNVGLKIATGDVIAFLDDDAYAEPEYVQGLRRAYADPTVALACSRTLNGQPGESYTAAEGVGRLLSDGRLVGNFAFDAGAGAVIDIDHGIGATMSFRRATLRAMGGFREDYSGVSGVREDTDAFLRAGSLGLRAVYVNDAVAHHMAAPQAKGMRFDLRYVHWGNRNHVLLLVNNFGIGSPLLRRWVAENARETMVDRSRTLLRRFVRLSVAMGGTVRGLAVVLARQRERSLRARLDGPAAAKLRVWLGQPVG